MVELHSHEEEDRFYQAILNNDIKEVFSLIEDGFDVNTSFEECPGGTSYSGLMLASYLGNVEVTEALLRAGADPCFSNSQGELTLFWAIDGGAKALRTVCKYGADVDEISSRGWSPLSYAAACQPYDRSYDDSDSDAVAILKEFGATVYGVGPPLMAPASERATFDVDETEASKPSLNPARRFRNPIDDIDDDDEDDEEDEERLDSCLTTGHPVGSDHANKEDEIRQMEAEDEEELREIEKELSRNPFIHEKGRANR